MVGATALPVLACAGGSKGALTLFVYPLGLVALFYGLPLLLSILIESAILHYRESVGWLESLALSLLTNLGGLTAVFIGTAAAFGSLSSLSVPALALQSYILGRMLIAFCRKTGCFLEFTKGLRRIQIYIWLLGMSYGSLALDHIVKTVKEPAIVSPAIATLFLIGFLFNLIVEGWLLSRLMLKVHPQLAATVFSMNVWSYGILPTAMLLSEHFTGKLLLS